MFIWYVRIPYMHSALFVCDAIFSHTWAKLATFESQKKVVCMIYLWNSKNEGEKG